MFLSYVAKYTTRCLSFIDTPILYVCTDPSPPPPPHYLLDIDQLHKMCAHIHVLTHGVLVDYAIVTFDTCTIILISAYSTSLFFATP